ncbi:CBS domain-containing protein [Halonotius terrestris]|uniref:CBS domain-containing protein n=1 Tax=Halonotius terrestris TaxID=2487750 RepID=A0A8J8TCL5_9EURY|nr:CBS domain-containing protein [Halonotius terrestris]TQQ81006.1 CBS domain-containing protein [Halonotius terrestris]
MRVRELMSTDLVTVPAETDMRTVAERMLHNRVGSVLVTNDGTPCGIVTETDALTVGYVANKPFSEVSVVAAMSHPLQTIEPTATVRTATERMIDEDIKKLPVVDELDVQGIITMTDIVRSHSDLLNEARKLERGRGDRDPTEWRGPFEE